MDIPTLASDAIARAPGAQAPTISKLVSDSRRYVVDCLPLLREHELATSAELVASNGVEVTGVRTRYGRYAQLEVAGGPESERPVDCPVTIAVNTNEGRFSFKVVFRVFS